MRISHSAHDRRLPRFAPVLLAGWLMFIFLLSEQSHPFAAMDHWLGLDHTFTHMLAVIRRLDSYDKYLHTLTWLILTALLWQVSLFLNISSFGKRACTVFMTAAVLGSIDEWHQYFTPERSLSLADWLADVFGVIILLFILAIMHRLQLRMQPKPLHQQGG